jgi:phage shock protein E
MSMKHCILTVALLMMGIVGAFAQIKDVSVSEFETLLKKDSTAILLDLRTTDELKKYGTIKNARQINYFDQDFERQLDRLDRNKVYLLFCASGARSGEAKEFMQSSGFTHVYNLPAGFNGWKKAKKPVVPFNAH